MVEKTCSNCGGKSFRIVKDEWMARTFRFVESGALEMCDDCGSKYLLCTECGGHYTRVHPALEAWEINKQCPDCGYTDPEVKAWDGVSAR